MVFRGVAVVTVLALVAVALLEGAQRFRGRSYDMYEPLPPTINPNFSFARVRFASYRQRRRPGWSHDYPRAERNLLRILSEVSEVYTEPAAHVIVPLEGPEIMSYPVLYFSEPGEWALTPEEAENFGSYLERGGFAIFDDFDGPWDWENLEACMARVLPGRHFERLVVDDPVFQSFFHIESLDVTASMGSFSAPEFWGIKDDAGRVQVVANYNNDIGEFWEWSEHGYYPIEISNEGYKIGVNYIIYALTH